MTDAARPKVLLRQHQITDELSLSDGVLAASPADGAAL